MIKRRKNIRYRTYVYFEGDCYGGTHLDRFRNVVRSYKVLGGFIEWVKIKHPDWLENATEDDLKWLQEQYKGRVN